MKSVVKPTKFVFIPPAIRSTRFQSSQSQKFDTIPETKPVDSKDVDTLARFISSSKKLVVISGAGISTESGIPDYRSPNGSYSKGHKPVTYSEFVKFPSVRQRYWARNLEGWPFFSSREPNKTHNTVAELENNGLVHAVITQNVDRLHQKAGSKRVTELHGHPFTINCVHCNYSQSRQSLQQVLLQLNPSWSEGKPALIPRDPSTRPDGDIELGKVDYSTFKLPTCPNCHGDTLKPAVVFFGENVPKQTVEETMTLVKEEADAMLVIGTSLMVYSAYRFVKAAHEKGIPIVAVNVGPTRADDLLKTKIEALCGEILPLVTNRLLH